MLVSHGYTFKGAYYEQLQLQTLDSVELLAGKLARQRKVPRRLEMGTSIPEAEKSVEDLYRKTYYEVIDLVLHAIRSRFDQKGYRILGRLESLLCDAEVDMNKYDDVLALYKDDFERDRLESQLCILHSNLPRRGNGRY